MVPIFLWYFSKHICELIDLMYMSSGSTRYHFESLQSNKNDEPHNIRLRLMSEDERDWN